MPRNYGIKGAKKQARKEADEWRQSGWQAASWASTAGGSHDDEQWQWHSAPEAAGGAWRDYPLPDGQTTAAGADDGDDRVAKMPRLSPAELPHELWQKPPQHAEALDETLVTPAEPPHDTLHEPQQQAADLDDKLWQFARVEVTGLMYRRIQRMDIELLESPDGCKILSFEVSQQVVEQLLPRLLYILHAKVGDCRGHVALTTRLRNIFSAIMTPDGLMRPWVTEDLWRKEFQAVADRLAGKVQPVRKTNRVIPGKIVSFIKNTKKDREEWGRHGILYKDSDGDLCSALYFIDTEAQVLPIDCDIYFVLSVSAKGLHSARQVSVISTPASV
jgi:hypothetical protein